MLWEHQKGTAFPLNRKLCNGDTSGINTQLKWNVARMDWISILAFVATVTSFTNQFVGIEICFHIVRKGNTGDISPVPFIAFFVSAAIWFKYGLMMKITNVILTSGLGTLLQFLYICFYYVYCTKKTQFYGFFIIGTIILFIPLLYVTFFEEEINVATQNIGLYCAGVGILCYASPLATLSKVIKQKSTSSISFPLCFVNFLCAVEWSLYGAAIEDYVLLKNMSQTTVWKTPTIPVHIGLSGDIVCCYLESS
ncbi:hypothetical protein Btru_074875 [Bulinus truncatus]|nr:hypothetical protein Btru_074875 [Bulinus truncatus]